MVAGLFGAGLFDAGLVGAGFLGLRLGLGLGLFPVISRGNNWKQPGKVFAPKSPAPKSIFRFRILD